MSFELELGRIPSKNTRKYLKEVISSYDNGNLRSAVVMLYSVFMTDLCEKLNELKTGYNDEVANQILEDLHRKDGEYYNRESEFIKNIKSKKRELFDVTAEATYISIKEWRNICAHPSLDNDRLEPLPSPNKEFVAGLIRSSIDNLFIQSAFLGKKIFSPLLEDISKVGEIFLRDETFESYVSHKYLNQFSPEIFEYILTQLFKMVFCIDVDAAEVNRNTNFRLLRIMIKRNSHSAIEAIANSNFISKIKLEDSRILGKYFSLLREYPSLYSKNIDFIKDKINDESLINKNPVNYLLNYYIGSSNMKEHMEKINNENDKLFILDENLEIDDELLHEVYVLCENSGCLEEYFRLATYMYGASTNYYDADNRYILWIRPYLNNYDMKSLEELIKQGNGNDQCYGRGRAVKEHRDVFEKYKNLVNNQTDENIFKVKWKNFLS